MNKDDELSKSELNNLYTIGCDPYDKLNKSGMTMITKFPNGVIKVENITI